MIFLTLIAIGALCGIVLSLRWQLAGDRLDASSRGAAGAFLIGALAVGLAEGSPGPFQPLVLGAGAAGAAAFVAAIEMLSRRRALTVRCRSPPVRDWRGGGSQS